MWIFTRYGFFSVVSARTADADKKTIIDPHWMMIRSRSRQHLRALQFRFSRELAAYRILAPGDTDYPYRIIVPKSAWVVVLAGLGAEIDYDNFKNEVSRGASGAAANYQQALHEVWHTMAVAGLSD